MRNQEKLMLLIVIVLLTFRSAFIQAVSQIKVDAKTKFDTYLLSEPSPLSTKIISIPRNSQVEILDYENTFYKAIYNGKVGFIWEYYVQNDSTLEAFKKFRSNENKKKQDDKKQIDNAPKSVELPPAFENFTATDVLKLIFSDYDSATGRTAKILNEDGKPSKVMLVEAKTWQTQNQERLIVLVGIEPNEGIFAKAEQGSLSGPEGYDVGMALLQKNAKKLELVAYTDLEYGFNNRYWSTTLDLAPYKLNATETLIGTRCRNWHPNSESNILVLYRIENKSLRQVFEREMYEKTYGGGITLTKLVLISEPNPKGFNDFQIKGKTTVTDIDDDKIISEQKVEELWRFDGAEFKKVN